LSGLGRATVDTYNLNSALSPAIAIADT
jgi:hypothetical protein